MSFGDDAARVLAGAGLGGERGPRRPGHDKAAMRRMGAAAYEAANARRAAELGDTGYQPGRVFNCALGMFGDETPRILGIESMPLDYGG